MYTSETRIVRYVCLSERFRRDVRKPYLDAIEELVDTGDFTLGPKVEKLEQEFSRYTGSNHAVGVSNGTEGLRLSLLALGIGPGDEVITTPTSFIATAASIALVGARPVFVDTNEEYLIDPTKIEDAITPNTKAILPVHWAGVMADMPKINAIAKKHGIKVVEDAAMAVGMSIDGKNAGTWGDLAEFSFHPFKNFCVWGDGGIITTDNEEYVENLKLLRNHGLLNRNEVKFFGYNSRLAPIQAVVASLMLKEIDSINEERRANSEALDQLLESIPQISIPPKNRPNMVPNCNQYMVLAEDRDELVKFLKTNGIDSSAHYPIPMHLQEASEYLGYKKGDMPVAEYQADHVITLPNHEHLQDGDLEYVASMVSRFYKR